MEKLLERIEALKKRTSIMTFVRNGEICFMGKGLSEKKDLQAKIDKLEQENKDLKKAIAYSRQFYYLPQNVLDLFSVLVPSNEYDEEISGAFYNRVMEGSDGEV